MVDFSRLEASIMWNEKEYNSPKKPYEIFSFGKHLETLLGEKKKEHFRYSINNLKQQQNEIETLLMKILDMTDEALEM